MILHVFECSECQNEQKHVTSTPTPLGLSYMSDCIQCKEVRTFSFVREGNRREDWYSNILSQTKKKRDRSQLNKARRKNDKDNDIEVAS
jgi:hypothetical protein